MKQYLFYNEKDRNSILKEPFSYIFLAIAVFMWIIAIAVMAKNPGFSVFMLLFGLIFFPGIPILLQCFYKAFTVEFTDKHIVRKARQNNVFTTEIYDYSDVTYIDISSKIPVEVPRGETPKRMHLKFGDYYNAYGGEWNHKFLFTFRADDEILQFIRDKNSKISTI